MSLTTIEQLLVTNDTNINGSLSVGGEEIDFGSMKGMYGNVIPNSCRLQVAYDVEMNSDNITDLGYGIKLSDGKVTVEALIIDCVTANRYLPIFKLNHDGGSNDWYHLLFTGVPLQEDQKILYGFYRVDGARGVLAVGREGIVNDTIDDMSIIDRTGDIEKWSCSTCTADKDANYFLYSYSNLDGDHKICIPFMVPIPESFSLDDGDYTTKECIDLGFDPWSFIMGQAFDNQRFRASGYASPYVNSSGKFGMHTTYELPTGYHADSTVTFDLFSVFSINADGDRVNDSSAWSIDGVGLTEENGYPILTIEYSRTFNGDYSYEYSYEITGNVIVSHHK